jgi:twitching motility protein PilT
VILVGEMRDLETASTALTAAETGHLVLSTLHTSDVAQAIHRIIDVFPGDQQSQVRQQLALAVSAIVCQQLVPRSDGQGRVAVFEILLANYAVRNHIRRDKLQNLYSEITLGRRNGMATLEESLGALVRKGVISVEEARMRANKPEELEAEVRGRGNVAD